MATKEAPGALDVIQSFVNTINVESGQDRIASAPALTEWLAERSLMLGGRASVGDVKRAAEVREALRALLEANAGSAPLAEAAAVLEQAAERARLRLRFGPDGTSGLEPRGRGVDGAMGRLLAVVAAAMADGTWSRLKACRAETCRWAFYDNTRNRSGVWCEMAVCGNRTKVRTYRRRHTG